MKIQKIALLVSLLLLTACAAKRINLATLTPDKALQSGLPLDANVLIYVARPYVAEDVDVKKLSLDDKREIIKKAAYSSMLKETSENIASKYFGSVNNKSENSKPTYVILLTGKFRTNSFDALRVLTVTTFAEVYDGEGKLISTHRDRESESTLAHLNEAVLFNAATKSQMTLYDEIFEKNRELFLSNTSVAFPDIDKIFDGKEVRNIGSASGFMVDELGHLVTNKHAVEGCMKVDIVRDNTAYPAEIVTASLDQDIALLVAKVVPGNAYAHFPQDKDARLGEDAIAIGYPLQGILTSKPTLTKGNISALAGTNNNESLLQFTAPIQPGSSGGPLLNETGHVIGLVTAKLNDVAMIKSTGQLPQNVNFATKKNTVLKFLSDNKIGVHYDDSVDVRKTADIAEDAVKYTYKINCHVYAVDGISDIGPKKEESF